MRITIYFATKLIRHAIHISFFQRLSKAAFKYFCPCLACRASLVTAYHCEVDGSSVFITTIFIPGYSNSLIFHAWAYCIMLLLRATIFDGSFLEGRCRPTSAAQRAPGSPYYYGVSCLEPASLYVQKVAKIMIMP